MSAEPENITATSESQLSDIITAIYYARHHLDEIPPIKEKINHLQGMLSTLEADQSLQVTSDSLENNLKQLQTELNDQVKKQTKQEQVVINGIKSILKNEEAAIFSKAVSKGASLKDFENFCKLLGLQVQKHSKVLQEELNSIRVSMQSFQLQSAIDEIKTSMMKEQERLIAMIHQKSKSDYQARFARLTEIASQLNVHEHLRLQTNNGIQMIKQVNAEMEAEQNQLEQQNANDIPDEIKQLVTHEITQLESLFQSKMTESQEKAIKEHKERVEALKKETTKIVDAIAQHKFMVDDVRIGINTMRDPTLESNANQEIMMKQMESAHHDIIQINNKLNTKIKEMEELVETPFNATFSPKKRVRAEGEDLNAKIQDADTYIQQLDDYVSQFKEAILEPMFPTRVEAAMNKIQHILVNHETFIAYLFNPTSVAKEMEAGHSSRMDPALLQGIYAIVEAQKESTSERLSKRLKTLEENIASTLEN